MNVEKVSCWKFELNEREKRALDPIVNAFLDFSDATTFPESYELAMQLKEIR